MVVPNNSVVLVSRRERVLHSMLFEVLLILLNIGFIEFLYPDKPLEIGGVVAVVVATIAMAWNYLFNLQFDWVFGQNRMLRSWSLRIWHAVAFELSLMLASLPVLVWLMEVSWIEALKLEGGMLLLALVFTLIYNRLFDQCRVWLVGAYPNDSRSAYR